MPSAETSISWTFKNGRKFSPDATSRARGVGPRKVMEATSSNRLTKYLVILWNDDVLSCNCPGWTILKKDSRNRPKPRTCKHCKEAFKNGYSAMTDVADFAPEHEIKSTQLNIGERQFRKIRIRNSG